MIFECRIHTAGFGLTLTIPVSLCYGALTACSARCILGFRDQQEHPEEGRSPLSDPVCRVSKLEGQLRVLIAILSVWPRSLASCYQIGSLR
jgi:hypothetical protein